MSTKLESATRPSVASGEPVEKAPAARLGVHLPGAADWLHARRRVIGTVAMFVLVAALVMDAFLWVRDGGEEGTVVEPEEVLTSAEKLLPEVLSYEFSALDDYRGRVDDRTTGDFREKLTELIDTRIEKVATRDKLVTRATVPAVGLVSLDANEAVVLAFVNQVTRRGRRGQPTIEGSRVRVTLVTEGGEWRIAELDPV